MDLLADFAEPLPAIVTAEMLGVPVEDHEQLKDWSVTSQRCSATSSTTPTDCPECCMRSRTCRVFQYAIREHATGRVKG